MVVGQSICCECGWQPCQCLEVGKIMYQDIELPVQKLDPNALLPFKKNKWDAGYDLYALTDAYLVHETPTKIRTGIAMAIPKGYVGLIWDRSGLGSRGIQVLGGVIDSTYRGELVVCLINQANDTYKIEKNDRIAQILLQKVENLAIIEVPELSLTDRGVNGFGSSGR